MPRIMTKQGNRTLLVRDDGETACEVVAHSGSLFGDFGIWQQGDDADHYTAYSREELSMLRDAMTQALEIA